MRYTNKDLFDWAGEIGGNLNYMVKFLKDTLTAAAFLQAYSMVHGDIRGEYIYFDYREKNFILMDRFNDVGGPAVA